MILVIVIDVQPSNVTTIFIKVYQLVNYHDRCDNKNLSFVDI